MEDIDIFITTSPHSALRRRMCDLVCEYWRWQGYVPVLTVCGPKDRPTFEIDRRMLAESAATTEIYILSDDDCLPLYQAGWLEGALRTFKKYPQFGMLSAFPDNETINPWTPGPPYDVVVNDDVWEHVSVGGLRFIRRGLVRGLWEPFNGRDYDASHCSMFNRFGYKVGYLRSYRMTHLGKYLSEIWSPQLWEKTGVGTSRI